MITVLIVALAVVALTSLPWWLDGRQKGLSRPEKRELRHLRALVNDLSVDAAQAAVLGENFAVQALSRITETRKEIQ